MKIRDIFNLKKYDNKYDMAIHSFYLIFYTAALIVFFAVGLDAMSVKTWIYAFFWSAFGATVYGTVAKLIINMIRNDKPKDTADLLVWLFRIVFFAIATVVFLTVGMEEKSAKTWIIAFIASYGTATIFSAISGLIVTLARKQDKS